ncbi:DUF2059 domain-containing protein [Qipengyuania sp. CAU 1752]
MRKLLFGTLPAMALATAAPLSAQQSAPQIETTQADESESSEEAEMAEAMAMLGAMFAVEPLTPEQEARLPLATTIIAKIMPEGAMAEMMDGMFNGMLGGLMQMGDEAPATSVLANSLGISADEMDLSEDQAAELVTLLDPAWRERREIEKAMLPEMMKTLMSAIEPAMRRAMSELYAINFTQPELVGIDAFFSTETGAKYARKSFTMASDPRVMSASMEAFPAMMGTFEDMEQRQKEATAHLPQVRSYFELEPAEKARIAAATGYTAQDLEAMSSVQTAAPELEDEVE